MLKKQGAFSDRYMSNPIQSPFTRDKNKQNRSSNINTNTNMAAEQNQSNTTKTNEHSENKLSRNSLSTKRLVNNTSKLKLEWEKHEKQLNEQITKLKKQNLKLKEDARKANKNNQENIFGYEAYIKQIENSRDEVANKLKIYEEQLKYCILWIVQTFSLGQNPIKNAILIQKKLNKSKMSQVMQKLNKTIHQLQLQKYLKQIIKASEKKKQQYLLYQKQHKQVKIEKNNCDQFCSLVSESNQLDDDHQSVQQFHDLLDTFNLNKEIIDQEDQQDEDAQPIQNIARKLFVNQETFGHQIGEHEISNQNIVKEDELFSNERAFIQSSSQSSIKSGTVVKIKAACCTQNDDYLKVKKGDEVRLLRKIGDLWIAQMGSKIGYISENLFN